jgi:hypothetical protein
VKTKTPQPTTSPAAQAEIMRVARCWEAMQGWPDVEFPMTREDAERLVTRKGC